MRFFVTQEDGYNQPATPEEAYRFMGKLTEIDFEGKVLAERVVDTIERNSLKLVTLTSLFQYYLLSAECGNWDHHISANVH